MHPIDAFGVMAGVLIMSLMVIGVVVLNTDWGHVKKYLAWRVRRPDPLSYDGDWASFQADLSRWRIQRPHRST